MLEVDVPEPAVVSPREKSARVSGGYRGWILLLLFLMMLSNYIDRSILNILAQPIKLDLRISDFQIGLLGGLSFALLYVFMGIPAARIAERRSRVMVISVSLVIWSALTALCGAAQNFSQLMLLRIGVGVGEAGAGPPSQSLISDYFPPERRASALAVYSLGVTLGGLAGAIFGGMAAQAYGWRAAFLIVGAPGLILATLIAFTVREPIRGRLDAAGAEDRETPSLGEVAGRLLRSPSFCLMAVGAGFSNMASQGVGQFSAAFFIRVHGLAVKDVGLLLGLTTGIAAAVGTVGGGVIGDFAAKHDRRWYSWMAAAGMVAATPLIILGYSQPTWRGALSILVIPAAIQLLFLGPILGITQNLVTSRMRATAVALLTVVTSAMGFGLGPMTAGFLSDEFAAHSFSLSGVGNYVTACPGGVPPKEAAAALKHACMAASGIGIRQAIQWMSIGHLIGGLFFLASGFWLRRDLDRAAAAR